MRRLLTWVGFAAATLVVVLIGLLLSLPLLLAAGPVKAAALQHLSRATGGQWRLARVELAWWPAPRISVEGASFSIPGALEGKVEALTVTPALLPLLWGDVRVSTVALIAPDITVIVAPTPASATARGTFTVSDLRAAITRMARLTAGAGRPLDFTVERGRFVLAVSNQTRLTLSEISGRAIRRSGRLEVEVTSASDVARLVGARGSVDPERFEGSVHLNATGIDLAALLVMAGVQGDPQLHGTMSARAQIKADGSPAVRGTFEASSNALSVARGQGKVDIQGLAAAGEMEWTDRGLRIGARDIRAVAPGVEGTAVLTFSPGWDRQRLEVKMQPAALESVKQVVLPWTRGTPGVEQYARMITSGQLGGLEATLQLDRIEQWQSAIEARGTVAGVAMALKQPEVPIRDLGATLVLAQGKLTAEGVRAATGNSTIHNGRITVDVAGPRTGVAATLQGHVDLGELLAVTKRQLAPRDRVKLEALRALAGDARGTVTLTGTIEQLHVLAEVDTIRAHAALEQVPWPIKVTGAKARFDGSELIVQGLAGTVGQSGFGQCSGQITLAAESRLQVSRCEADAELVELFDWASKQFELPDPAKGLRVVAGRGLVQIHSITGALAEPAKWSGDVSVTPKALRLIHPEVPGELRLDGGSVRGDLGSLTVQGVKAEILDAALQVSGSVSGLRDGKPRLEAQATGPVGERLLAWGGDRFGAGHEGAHIAPFEARPVMLRWPVNGGFETRGDLMFAGKTTVSFDALIQPGMVDVRRLAVQDEQSRAQLSLRWQQGIIEGSFAGDLAGVSPGRMAPRRQQPDARMSGNVTYRVPIKQPRDFRANGELRINQVTSAGWVGQPDLTLRSVDLTAAGRSLRLVTSFSVQDTSFDVSGTIRGTDQGYALDMDVKSDHVDMDRLVSAHDHLRGAPSQERPTSWDFPVAGTVRLAIQSLRRGAYLVAPLHATWDIAPGQIDVAVKEARLCGIGMAGRGRALPATVSIELALRARDLDAAPTLLCLTRERTVVTGRLHADARLTATGAYGERPQRIQGPFHLVAQDGRVDRMTGLAQILDVVNTSGRLHGKKLELRASGFAYSKLEVNGRLEGGAILIDELVLDAEPFDAVAQGSVNWLHDSVDMNVAVAPFQTLTRMVKLVPFLGHVLGSGVYAVPVGMRGKASDPQIVPVPPSAVAGSLLGMLERFLKTPFNLREALVPPAMQGGDGAASPAPASPSNSGPKQ